MPSFAKLLFLQHFAGGLPPPRSDLQESKRELVQLRKKVGDLRGNLVCLPSWYGEMLFLFQSPADRGLRPWLVRIEVSATRNVVSALPPAILRYYRDLAKRVVESSHSFRTVFEFDPPCHPVRPITPFYLSICLHLLCHLDDGSILAFLTVSRTLSVTHVYTHTYRPTSATKRSGHGNTYRNFKTKLSLVISYPWPPLF